MADYIANMVQDAYRRPEPVQAGNTDIIGAMVRNAYGQGRATSPSPRPQLIPGLDPNAMPEGWTPDPQTVATQNAVDAELSGRDSLGPATARAAGNILDSVTSGTTFGIGDELTAHEAALLGRKPGGGTFDLFNYDVPYQQRYERALEAERMQNQRFRSEAPGAAFAGEMAGMFLNPAARWAAGKVSGPLTGGGVGGGLAFAYGAGEGEGGLENRLESGLRAAPFGMAGGAAVPMVARGGGAVGREIQNQIARAFPKGKRGQAIQRTSGAILERFPDIDPGRSRAVRNWVTREAQRLVQQKGPSKVLEADEELVARWVSSIGSRGGGNTGHMAEAGANVLFGEPLGAAYHGARALRSGGAGGPPVPRPLQEQATQFGMMAAPVAGERGSAVTDPGRRGPGGRLLNMRQMPTTGQGPAHTRTPGTPQPQPIFPSPRRASLTPEQKPNRIGVVGSTDPHADYRERSLGVRGGGNPNGILQPGQQYLLADGSVAVWTGHGWRPVK